MNLRRIAVYAVAALLAFVAHSLLAALAAPGVALAMAEVGTTAGVDYNVNEAMKIRTQYEMVEMAWVGDFNPKMKKIYELVGGKFVKQHNTYRYMFDRSQEVIPYKVIMEEKLVPTV